MQQPLPLPALSERSAKYSEPWANGNQDRNKQNFDLLLPTLFPLYTGNSHTSVTLLKFF
jgi:hypothetical protein